MGVRSEQRNFLSTQGEELNWVNSAGFPMQKEQEVPPYTEVIVNLLYEMAHAGQKAMPESLLNSLEGNATH